METTTPNPAQIRHRLIALAKKGRFEQVEELWLEFLASAPTDADLYIQILRVVGHSNAAESGLTMLLLLLDQLMTSGEWEAADKIVVALAHFWPTSAELRKVAIEVFRNRYADSPEIDNMIRSSGLEGNTPLGEAVSNFDFFHRVSPGQAYKYVGRGIGVVSSADFQRDRFTLDFPNEKGRAFTAAGVKEFLIYLPPDHFLARRATDPEGLAQLAKEDPAELVRLVVRGQGGRIKQGDLKIMILEGVLPKSRWNSWWGKAREALKIDPFVKFDGKGGAHAEIVLRDDPVTLAEEIEERFFDPKTTHARHIAEVKKLESVKSSSPPDTELLRRMLIHLNDLFEKTDRLADRVDIALMAEDLTSMATDEIENVGIDAPKDVIGDEENYNFLTQMANDDYAIRALDILVTRDGDASVERMAPVLPVSSSKIVQAMWKQIGEPQHRAVCVRALKVLFDKPEAAPDTYAWVLKGIVEGRWPHLADNFPLTSLVPVLLDRINEWSAIVEVGRSSREQIRIAKLLISRTKSILKVDRCKIIFDIALAMPQRYLDELDRQLQRHPSLDNDFRSEAQRRVGAARRVRDQEMKDSMPEGTVETTAPVETDASEETAHYCTLRARDEKVLELQDLKSVTIPENTRLMEEARQEGDLKENAAYHAAKDRHKFLANLSAQMQMQLQKARVYDASMVRENEVGFGVTFTVRNLKTDAQETFTILGSWEADTDKNILNYQAPFCQSFLGRAQGDEVSVEQGESEPTRYRIEKIENALASGEWDKIPNN